MANRRRRMAPYLFISPFFIGYAIFFLYPVLWALYLSFFQQVGIGSEPKFVGLQNYANLLSDDTFRTALVNTTYYAAGSIFIIVPLALLLAVVLFMRSLRGREFFRLFFFSPNITSGVVVGIIFTLVFSADYGLINNYILKAAWPAGCTLAAGSPVDYAGHHHFGHLAVYRHQRLVLSWPGCRTSRKRCARRR